MNYIYLVLTLFNPFTQKERAYCRMKLIRTASSMLTVTMKYIGEFLGFCEEHIPALVEELRKKGWTFVGWLEPDPRYKFLGRKIHCRFCEEVPEKAERLYIELRR